MQTLQLKRATTAENDNYVGDPGEIVVLTDDNYRAVVHDGTTSGGFPLALESEVGSLDPIGSKGVHHWQYANFTSPWPDDVGSADMTINGLTDDGTSFGGSGGISGDGSSDHGLSTWSGWASNNLAGTFAIEFALQTSTTTQSELMSQWNDSNFDNTAMANAVRGDASGEYELLRQDDNGTRQQVRSSTAVNDGNPHHVVVNVFGASDTDIDIWIDNSEDSTYTQVDNGDLSSVSNFANDMGHFARNVAGSLGNYFDGDQREIVVYNDTLTSGEIDKRYTSQPWV